MLPERALGCRHAAPNFVASRTPFHGGISTGGVQRAAATGGCAYGTPLKTFTVPSAIPFTVPAGARTTGYWSAAAGRANIAATLHAKTRKRNDIKGCLQSRPLRASASGPT